MVQNDEFFFFCFFIVVGFVFLYVLDMDSINEENDEYGDPVSSAPNRAVAALFPSLNDS